MLANFYYDWDLIASTLTFLKISRVTLLISFAPTGFLSKPRSTKSWCISKVTYLERSITSLSLPSGFLIKRVGLRPDFQVIFKSGYASACPGSFKNLRTSGSRLSFHPWQLMISAVSFACATQITAKATTHWRRRVFILKTSWPKGRWFVTKIETSYQFWRLVSSTSCSASQGPSNIEPKCKSREAIFRYLFLSIKMCFKSTSSHARRSDRLTIIIRPAACTNFLLTHIYRQLVCNGL